MPWPLSHTNMWYQKSDLWIVAMVHDRLPHHHALSASDSFDAFRSIIIGGVSFRHRLAHPRMKPLSGFLIRGQPGVSLTEHHGWTRRLFPDQKWRGSELLEIISIPNRVGIDGVCWKTVPLAPKTIRDMFMSGKSAHHVVISKWMSIYGESNHKTTMVLVRNKPITSSRFSRGLGCPYTLTSFQFMKIGSGGAGKQHSNLQSSPWFWKMWSSLRCLVRFYNQVWPNSWKLSIAAGTVMTAQFGLFLFAQVNRRVLWSWSPDLCLFMHQLDVHQWREIGRTKTTVGGTMIEWFGNALPHWCVM